MSSILRTKKIALVDCNSFYVSCERLFNPKIRRKPVVVFPIMMVVSSLDPMKQKLWELKWVSPTLKVKILLSKIKLRFFPQTILCMVIYLEE